MEVLTYVRLHDLVDYQVAQGHWIHAKVLEFSEDCQSCQLSLFNNRRDCRFVLLSSSDIAPFHSHDLSAALSDTKYLRYWVFTAERLEESKRILENVLSNGLLSLSAYDTVQFFGAKLPHLFAHSISTLQTGSARLTICEEVMTMLGHYLQSIDLLARSEGSALGSVERALWTCWPEFVFILGHVLEDLPASAAPEDLFDVAVSDFTSAKSSRLCAHLLERFAQAGGFDALIRCFGLPLPLEFLIALPVLRLAAQLTNSYRSSWARSVVENVLQACPSGSEPALTLLTTAYRLAIAADLHYGLAFRLFLERTAEQQSENSSQFLWVVRAALQLSKVSNEETHFQELLTALLRSETQLSLLSTGQIEAGDAVEQYAMTLATHGQLPAALLELYVCQHRLLSDTFLHRLLSALVQKQQWVILATLETLPAGDFSMTLVKGAKQRMPLSHMMRLFPRVNATNAARLVEALLIGYSLEHCAWAFINYFHTPQRLLAVVPASKRKAYIASTQARAKFAYFLLTLQRLLFLWVGERLPLPRELVQVVAQEFL